MLDLAAAVLPSAKTLYCYTANLRQCFPIAEAITFNSRVPL
jgi:hypothetical protein